jgi:Smg protein
MFDVLIYVYETYYRPDACPDRAALVQKLSAVGFEEDEITQALSWLAQLTQPKTASPDQYPVQQPEFATSMRIYHEQEWQILGTEVIGFIKFLELTSVLDANQREIVIERALAIGDGAISLDEIKIIVLLVLWSQGQEPDILIFDELFAHHEEDEKESWH